MRERVRCCLPISLLAGAVLLVGCADDPSGASQGSGDNNGGLDLDNNNGADQGANNGADQGDNNGADQGENNGQPDADPDLPADQGGACSPNPCLQPPAPSCREDGVTLVSAAPQGTCTESDGMARCEYPEMTTNCGAQGRVCQGGACVIKQNPAPGVGQVIITEIMYNPLGISDEDAEFIELFNTGERDLGLDTCALEDDTQNTAALTGVVVPAGGYALIGRNLNPELNGGVALDGVFAFGLGNSGDTITLRCGELEIDAVTYDDGGAFPEATGTSLSLNPSAYDAASNDLGANWCLSSTVYYTDPMDESVTNAGSPGEANAACPERDVCDPNPCDQAPAPECQDEATLLTYAAPGLCEEDEGVARCQYEAAAVDCAAQGRLCRAGACVLDLPVPEAGEVVVTEIMYDPVGISDEAGEWVELTNVGQRRVTLGGCRVSDAGGAVVVVPELVLEPGGLALLGRSADVARNGGLGVDALFSFGLNNGGDAVILECGDQVIDSVEFDGGELWPDLGGASLSLDPAARDAAANDSPEAWCLGQEPYWTSPEDAAVVNTGTPGEPNPPCPVVDVEVDLCRLGMPLDAQVLAGSQMMLRGRVFEDGITTRSAGVDADMALTAQAGFGPDGSDPAADAGWRWFGAAGAEGWDDAQEPGYDEYVATLAAPAVGTYDHAFRFSRDGGRSWRYCDRDGSGNGYAAAQAGSLMSLPSPCAPNPCATPPAAVCADEATLMTYQSPGSCSVNGLQAACEYPPALVDCAAQGRECVEGACVQTVPGPAAGEVVITEIMANPVTLSDDEAEWVELYNRSGRRLNLTGCMVGDSTPANAEALPALFIEAGQRLLLGTSQDAEVNGGLEIAATFGFGLNNSGDVFFLRCEGALIDEVDFRDGAGFVVPTGASLSLDPGSLSAAANDAAGAWCVGSGAYWEGESTANLGTPGAANPSCPDACDPNPCVTPPVAMCEGEVAVTFARQGSCEVVEGDPLCSYDASRVNCAQTGQICQLGACVAAPVGRAPAPGEVVITEIMYDPNGELTEERAEWVELYNNAAETLRLTGCIFRDNDMTHRASLDAVVMEPGSYAVLGRVQDMAANGGLTLAATFNFGLNNGGDGALVICDGEIIDEVNYDDGGEFPNASSATISLDPEAYGMDNAVGARWCLATEPYYSGATPHLGTPGAANGACPVQDACEPNPCALPADYCLDETILVFYGGDLECVDVDGEALCDDPIEDLFDCADLDQICVEGACVDAPLPGIGAGEVIFNEIMFDPNSPLVERNAEWFELYNTTDRMLSLEGCVFQDNIATTAPVGAVSIPPRGYVVFAGSADMELNGGVRVAGTMSLALGNGGDILTLRCNNSVVDVVDYNLNGFRLIATAALSLDPGSRDATANNEGVNWCPATSFYYNGSTPHRGTPNEPNPPCP